MIPVALTVAANVWSRVVAGIAFLSYLGWDEMQNQSSN